MKKRDDMKATEVLMVEDNPGDVVLLREALTKAGIHYRITVMRDGMEALEYLRRQGKHSAAISPELIVLDLKLPRKSGREILDDIRNDHELLTIPLIVLSSSRSELELARLQDKPGRSFMVKPSTFPDYVALAGAIEAFRLETRLNGGSCP